MVNRDALRIVAWTSLIVGAAAALLLKLPHLGLGSPHVTIDDITAYKGGFLVWFGNAPPQRMYLESWVIGATSILAFVGKMIAAGQTGALGPNLVAEAYRDFHGHPELYVKIYRALMLLVDLATAGLVFLLGRIVTAGRDLRWLPPLAAALFLLSYNTIWCGVVARPDTLTTFFGVLGLVWYYRSDFGRNRSSFLLAAVAFGLCTGMKLHGAFFVVFILIDMIREHGWRRGFVSSLPLLVISVAVFAVAAGSPLFDPLKYVKLRMLNAVDDESPWIRWGEQFIAAARGMGWLPLPLVLWSAVQTWRTRRDPDRRIERSLVLLACGWLLLFCSIRQLRPYWMLPALPLFYLVALQALAQLRSRSLAAAAAGVLVVIFSVQSIGQARELRAVDYTGLRDWVEQNIQPDEPFFLFGYGALDVPRNTRCMANIRQGLEAGLEADLEAGIPHVERHLKNWEEQSALALMDMLGYRYDEGYEFYTYYGTPLDRFGGIIDIHDMRYVLVQEGFENPEDFALPEFLAAGYDLVAVDVTGNGGGGTGVGYRIYERRTRDER